RFTRSHLEPHVAVVDRGAVNRCRNVAIDAPVIRGAIPESGSEAEEDAERRAVAIGVARPHHLDARPDPFDTRPWRCISAERAIVAAIVPSLIPSFDVTVPLASPVVILLHRRVVLPLCALLISALLVPPLIVGTLASLCLV